MNVDKRFLIAAAAMVAGCSRTGIDASLLHQHDADARPCSVGAPDAAVPPGTIWHAKIEGVGWAVASSADGGFVFGSLYDQNPETACLDAAVLTRVDVSGVLVWAKTYDLGTGCSHVGGVASVPLGGAVFVGTTAAAKPLHFGETVFEGPGAFIVAVDASGHMNWVRTISGDLPLGLSQIAVDEDGRVFIAGTYSGDLSMNGDVLQGVDDYDVFVLALDPKGERLWHKRFGEGGRQFLTGMALGAAHEVVVSGANRGDVDFGIATFHAAGRQERFLTMLDVAGEPLWANQQADPGQLLPQVPFSGGALAVTENGSIALVSTNVASTTGGPDAHNGTSVLSASLFDRNGALSWSKNVGGMCSRIDYQLGATITADGDIVASGAFAGAIDAPSGRITSSGNFDGLLAAFGPDSEPKWLVGIGDSMSQGVTAVSAMPSGNLLVLMSAPWYGNDLFAIRP
jgi:hypothetical protein